MTTDALLSLLRLTSSSLPVGAFAYSQGIEYAVEAGWIRTAAEARDWISGLLLGVQRHQDVPLFARIYRAWEMDNHPLAARWDYVLMAWRETAELRAEERATGAALAHLLVALDVRRAGGTASAEAGFGCATMFALACVEWGIPLRDAAAGYLWSWCQNQVAAAVKIVPLGQTAGQRIVVDLTMMIPAIIESALAVADDDIGFSAPGLVFASARHEAQYTRLFLS